MPSAARSRRPPSQRQCLSKPVDLHELTARLRAQVHRALGQPQEQLFGQGLTLALEPASATGGLDVRLSTPATPWVQARS